MMNKTILFIGLSLLLIDCNYDKNKIDETPTRGNIKISADESYLLIMNAEIDVFQSLYEYATIHAIYKPEVDVINDLMNDSVRLVIVNKKLTKAQEQLLISKQIIPKTTRIAYDALALIVNKENTDTTITCNQLKEIFLGKTTKWNQLDESSGLSDIVVVFDNNKSGNVRYIKEKFEIKQNFPSNCFAVNSNPEVINYVEKNKNALGVIGVNWISDNDDSVSNNFLQKVRVVEVSDNANAEDKGNYYKPYPAYIADVSYPLRREVYMINRETFTGLGTGFVAFVAGDQGQRIILKGGLVPATMPIRLVEIKR